MSRRLASGVWIVVLAACALFTAGRVRRGNAVNTSLLSLLPSSEGDPLLTQANQLLSERASHLMAFVAGHKDPAIAEELGRKLKEGLRTSGVAGSFLTELSAEQQKAFYDLYFPYRYQMLSPGDRRKLQLQDALHYFIDRLMASLYSPLSPLLKNLIPQDPFLTFPELIRSWIETAVPHGAGESIAYVDSDGTSYAFVAIELARDPFDSKSQDVTMAQITKIRAELLKQWPDSHVYMSGVLPFAFAERRRTEREMTMVGAGSLTGVLVLTALAFASVRALILAAVPITAGFLVAAAATLLCFGKIHIITFAFGSSLIGVAIDYPLLYLAFHRTAGRAWNSFEAIRQAAPGLLLGALTTLFGYAALSLAPFPGLRQMALFSSAGLAAALMTVLLWFPLLLKKGPAQVTEPWIAAAGVALLEAMGRSRRAWRKGAAIVLAALAVLTIIGLRKARFDDDIRRLQSPPESVAQEDAFVRKAIHGMGGSQFILVRGEQVEQLLERQEALQEKLRELLQAGTVSSFQSLAPFLPSLRRQEADRSLLQHAILENVPGLRRALAAVGLAPKISNELVEDLRSPVRPFSIEAWLASPASEMLRTLWVGSTSHGVAAAVLIGGLTNAPALRDALKSLEGVRFFDQVDEYTSLFRRYRRLSIGLIFAAYVGVWGLMNFRYGWKLGTLVTAPSIMGVLLTFAIFGWWGIPIHLIHCLSALLILSMGVDYSIYFAECARAGRPVAPTLLAVELCACATLISFGLLALCKTPVLSSIGRTVFPGIAIAALLSPLSYRGSAAEQHSKC